MGARRMLFVLLVALAGFYTAVTAVLPVISAEAGDWRPYVLEAVVGVGVLITAPWRQRRPPYDEAA